MDVFVVGKNLVEISFEMSFYFVIFFGVVNEVC